MRATEGVAPSDVGRVYRLLANDVVPALARLVGPELVVPESLTVRPGREGVARPEGEVPARLTEDGRVVGVEAPAVSALDDDATLRFVLAHELAHFHELSVRRAQGPHLGNLAASVLWSEYYAQRVVWATFGMPPGSLDVGRVEDLAASDDAARPGRGSGYLFAWLRAHHDARSDWLDFYPNDKRTFLEIFVPGIDKKGRLDRLFERFPTWDEADAAWVSAVFQALDGVRLAGRKVGSKKRRHGRR